jgi:hypothetical protein
LQRPDDALNAKKMNVSSGGAQPVMRATEYKGHPQEMVLPSGQPKGLKIVLQERKLWRSDMKKDEMAELLSACADFKAQLNCIEELCKREGVRCVPK